MPTSEKQSFSLLTSEKCTKVYNPRKSFEGNISNVYHQGRHRYGEKLPCHGVSTFCNSCDQKSCPERYSENYFSCLTVEWPNGFSKVSTRSIFFKDRGLFCFSSYLSPITLLKMWLHDLLVIVLSYYNQKLNMVHSQFILLGINAALNSATRVK